MLVLSRGPDEKIVFPNLGITVQILRIAGNRVRIGVDAPSHIRVLREEIVLPEDFVASAVEEKRSRKLSHELRNRLHVAGIALHLAQKQVQAGMTLQAEGTIQRALREFDTLDAELERAKANPPGEPVRRRALLVEDDLNESTLLAGYLEMSGYVVDAVEDGLAAVRYLSEHEKPDVILLDMHMPRLDGPQTISSIRCNPRLEGLRLFAVSGMDQDDVRVAIGPNGVDQWFSKPINPRRLVEAMDRSFRTASASA